MTRLMSDAVAQDLATDFLIAVAVFVVLWVLVRLAMPRRRGGGRR